MREGLIIDCFAGGGGASTGIEKAFGRPVDIAINHDPEAIRMHKVNHPHTLHLTEDIFEVDLEKYVGGRHVAFMWASPDCTSHSKAKGGQPRLNGLRILPWAVYKHARAIKPDVIIMENVEEIQEWGPLDEKGYPIKDRKGEEYWKFMHSMEAIGYSWECHELVAADYGAPTTRKRWYAVLRRDGEQIGFPAKTHSKNASIPGTEKWEECGKLFDWSDLGKSIFDRSKPLADKTQKRIASGIMKYVVENKTPYIVDDAGAAAFLIQYHSEQKDGGCRGQSLDEPIKTIDTSNRYGLVSAFITKFYKTGIGSECSEPIHTITTSPGHFGLVSAFLTSYYGNGTEQGCTEPLRTITTKDRFGLVSAFLIKYYGGFYDGVGSELSDPIHTIETKDRFGLVSVPIVIDGEEYVIGDIFLRMLKPEELKRCQGFPDNYIIDHDIEGKPYPLKEQVARIGNSVVPTMAYMLTRENVCVPNGKRHTADEVKLFAFGNGKKKYEVRCD